MGGGGYGLGVREECGSGLLRLMGCEFLFHGNKILEPIFHFLEPNFGLKHTDCQKHTDCYQMVKIAVTWIAILIKRLGFHSITSPSIICKNHIICLVIIIYN